MFNWLFKKKSACGWCGIEVVGKPVSPFHASTLVAWGGGKEAELLPEFECGFCSDGCAWAFGAENEKLHGMKGKELRVHLRMYHGLTYAVTPRPQCAESCAHFETEARVMSDWMLRQRLAEHLEASVN